MATPARDNITIAITVYDRRTFLDTAVRSVLKQRDISRCPAVIVVEDCGPDLQLREQTMEKFGDQIVYHRNARRRGLFGNWNACLEICSTEWLCILHDDDFLEPGFVEAMMELATAAPDRALYYGRCHVIDEQGNRIEKREAPERFEWEELPLEAWARYDPVCFPGQLFNVAAARGLGGFRASSHYCADWEMWFRLALNFGAAATNRVVANYREHFATGRGTTRVDVSGRKYALVNAQRKRFATILRGMGTNARFDRVALQRDSPMPARFLLEYGDRFSPRMLRYNTALFLRSKAPNSIYRFFQLVIRLFSWHSLPLFSRLFHLFAGFKK
jgi:glycosyltransferase involved in cell wall biosynthesis